MKWRHVSWTFFSSWSRCTLSWPYAHPLTLTPPPLFTCQGREAPSLCPPGPPPPPAAPEGAAHSHLESQRSGPLPQGPPKGPYRALIEGTCIYRRPNAAHTQKKIIIKHHVLEEAEWRLSGACAHLQLSIPHLTFRPGVQLSNTRLLKLREKSQPVSQADTSKWLI